MKQRTITSIFFALAMLGGVYGGKYTFFGLFAVVAGGSLWELGSMLFTRTTHPAFRRLALLLVGLLPYGVVGWSMVSVDGSAEPALRGVAIGEMLLLFGLFAVELFLRSERPFDHLGHYALGVLYVGIPYVLLVDIALWTGSYSPNRVFGLLWLIWTNDSAAYLVGSKWGKNKLFERISPKKTWEGVLGALVITILMAWLLSMWVPDFSRIQWLILAVLASVFGPVGDLVESMLKRSLNVKDSGDLFPGHGGFLDRFDAFMYYLPFAWAALMLIVGLSL